MVTTSNNVAMLDAGYRVQDFREAKDDSYFQRGSTVGENNSLLFRFASYSNWNVARVLGYGQEVQ
jgi:hypothetical protein